MYNESSQVYGIKADGGTHQFENDQLTGHFQSFFFLNIYRTNSKTSKVNQQSVLYL